MEDHDSAKCNQSEGLEIELRGGKTLKLEFEQAKELVASKVEGVITQEAAVQAIRDYLAGESKSISLSDRILKGESSFDRIIEQFAGSVVKALNGA